MAKKSLLDDTVRDEVRRTVLRLQEERYRHELLHHEERMQLQDRIKRLRRRLGIH